MTIRFYSLSGCAKCKSVSEYILGNIDNTIQFNNTPCDGESRECDLIEELIGTSQ